jgi:GntR family transcriptional repressor for pyruvate dehydrogenase complex
MREAIIRLRAGSPFLSRQGYRTFIDCHPDAYHPLLPFADISCVEDLRQCYEFRRTIEGGAAKYAALNRDGDDIENIWQAFYRLHVSNTLEENSVDADLAFHITIAEASRNPLVLAVLKSLRNQISFAMDLSRKFSPSHQPQRKEAVKQEHRRVVEAIVRKDSIAAEAAMQFHIGMATVRLVGT